MRLDYFNIVSSAYALSRPASVPSTQRGSSQERWWNTLGICVLDDPLLHLNAMIFAWYIVVCKWTVEGNTVNDWQPRTSQFIHSRDRRLFSMDHIVRDWTFSRRVPLGVYKGCPTVVLSQPTMPHFARLFIFAIYSCIGHVALAENGPCSGTAGICVSTSTCSGWGGTSVIGFCPTDPDGIRCCWISNCGGPGSFCGWPGDCFGGHFLTG